MTTSEFVTQWALDTVQRDYREDIALVVAHNSLSMDDSVQTISYFVPITERGQRFAQTFILEGLGIDVWGISWERLERFAALQEYNTTCLADGTVLYARTPEDRQRFEALQQRLAKNLADPLLQRARALEAFAQARQIYLDALFANGGDAKMGVGYVLDYLARAMCSTHGRYFKRAQTDQLAELEAMGPLPDGFAETYNAVIWEPDTARQLQLCHSLIAAVAQFLERPAAQREHNFQDLASWYCEMSYTWLRIRHYAEVGDITKTYMWGCLLQTELNEVCRDFGLPKMELMEVFDAANLKKFAEHADTLEQQMRAQIVANGGVIREYRNREEFLHEV